MVDEVASPVAESDQQRRDPVALHDNADYANGAPVLEVAGAITPAAGAVPAHRAAPVYAAGHPNAERAYDTSENTNLTEHLCHGRSKDRGEMSMSVSKAYKRRS